MKCKNKRNRLDPFLLILSYKEVKVNLQKNLRKYQDCGLIAKYLTQRTQYVYEKIRHNNTDSFSYGSDLTLHEVSRSFERDLTAVLRLLCDIVICLHLIHNVRINTICA